MDDNNDNETPMTVNKKIVTPLNEDDIPGPSTRVYKKNKKTYSKAENAKIAENDDDDDDDRPGTSAMCAKNTRKNTVTNDKFVLPIDAEVGSDIDDDIFASVYDNDDVDDDSDDNDADNDADDDDGDGDDDDDDGDEKICEKPQLKVKSMSKLEKLKKTQDTEDDEELAQLVTAEEYLMNKDMILLEYEKRMFLDFVFLDGLLIAAKGIQYDRVLVNILKVYADAGNLVLVINFSDWEEKHYKSKLDTKHVHEVANTANERERVYLEGGIQFISTRILVVDLLKKRIPVDLITGIVVLRAHNIVESCQEAFVLRLYRQQNKTGFIKAFSSNPEAFTIGFSHVERTMRNLFVKELYIWPRFHALVQMSFKPYESQTVELHVPLTEKMKHIQANILDIMNFLVREIKRINRFVDMEEITVENCVTKNFHKILQAQLDCIWHQLNSQTKLIVADLKILRNIMIASMYSDAVSAYALIKRYRSTGYVHNNSGWTLLDSADQIFKISKERVYNAEGDFEPEHCPKWCHLAEILKTEIPNDMKCNKSNSVNAPKVLILCQDTRTCYQLKQYLTQGAEPYLLYSAMKNQVTIGKLGKTFQKMKNYKDLETNLNTQQQQQQKQQNVKSDSQQKQTNATKTEANEVEPTEIDELTQLLSVGDNDEPIDAIQLQESYLLTMTQKPLIDNDDNEDNEDNEDIKNKEEQQDNSVFEPFPELENLDITAAVSTIKDPIICIHTFKTENEGAMALERTLEEIQPQYIIMYHCNVTAIRQLEAFEARLRRPANERLVVFFLIHARTVEEQSYLTSLRREKQAFEFIIDTKSKMVVPEYQDGKTDEAFMLYSSYKDDDDIGSDNDVENTNAVSRKAGGQNKEQQKLAKIQRKIIVDMREFRSDLPCLIHKRGIEVLPVTITIGDYILTPEICIERKSISDLIGSLNSGRLYNQCIQMQRFYAKPILLIEFDQNKPFHLQGKFMLSHNTNATNVDIMQKLQLLTLHFPKLRLIWSPSPYATALLFEELKQGKEEPDPKRAAAIGSDETSDGGAGAFDDSKYNPNIYDFLLRLPGINTRNIHKLMRLGGSLKKLMTKSKTELGELLDSQENGKLLWDILHIAYRPEKDDVQGSVAMLATGKKFSSHSRFRQGAAANIASKCGNTYKK